MLESSLSSPVSFKIFSLSLFSFVGAILAYVWNQDVRMCKTVFDFPKSQKIGPYYLFAGIHI